ncbi:Lrp/AsnC family transcriptional regulator [Leucobacter chromiireducens]|nr:Lrp/AsnC family transcriptional regulator [Leucobacter chromiireducens]
MPDPAPSPGQVAEIDLRLLHLLQIAPRASWSDAAPIVGVSPGTLAARWSALQRDGLAWLSVYPSHARMRLTVGFIEVSVLPDRRGAFVARVCADARVSSVDVSSGGADLLLTVIVADFAELRRLHDTLLADELGVTRTVTRLVTEMHAEGGDWRLDSLGRAERASAARLAGGPNDPDARPIGGEFGELVGALALRPRASVAELARELGDHPATLRRRLHRLLHSGAIRIRLDTAPEVSGWPIELSVLARVPGAAIPSVVRTLLSIPQVKLCASLTGEANLVFSVVARQIAHLAALERSVLQAVPELTVVETTVTMRRIKRMGHRVDAAGFATGDVTPPHWA